MSSSIYFLLRFNGNRISRSGLIIVVGLLFLFALRAWSATVHESEPNNDFTHADPIQCGDTVLCASISPTNNLDHFRFTIPYEGDSIFLMTFDCNGSRTNTFMVLYSNRDSVLGIDDNSGPGTFSKIFIRAPYAGEYVVRILYVQTNPDTNYSLSLVCPVHVPEDYDLCSTPRIIPSLPYYSEGTTIGMRSECGTAARDVYYKFYNPIVQNIWVLVCTNSFNARVARLSRCCSQQEDANTGCNRGARLDLYDVPVGEQYIMVEGTSANQAGAFSIEVMNESPPCPTPTPLLITLVGGHPFLDWPEAPGPSYYIIWSAVTPVTEYDHYDITFQTSYWDTNTVSSKRFYKVTAVCMW